MVDFAMNLHDFLLLEIRELVDILLFRLVPPITGDARLVSESYTQTATPSF